MTTIQRRGRPASGRWISTLGVMVMVGPLACGPGAPGPSGEDSVVDVAPPTGSVAEDRAAIVAALQAVEPGGTVQFAPGVYLTGEVVPVSVEGVTLQGHADGTTLRGCEPDEYDAMTREVWAADASSDLDALTRIVRRCGTMELLASGVTVRGFVIEYSRLGICTNGCTDDSTEPAEGGFTIEDNVFRNSSNGVRPAQTSTKTTVIRRNRFENTFHAVSGAGGHTHVTDNVIVASSPGDAPEGLVTFAIGFVGDAIPCEELVIENNRIEGYAAGVSLVAVAGGLCERNAIRNNRITIARVTQGPAESPFIPLDSTYVDTAVQLFGMSGAGGASGGRVESNVVEGNVIRGAEGVAIALTRASGNRIEGNVIEGVRTLRPFPGHTEVLGWPPEWGEANGTALWVSPMSHRNRIVANEFRDLLGPSVVVAGDDNVVFLQPGDSIEDYGDHNDVRVVGAGVR